MKDAVADYVGWLYFNNGATVAEALAVVEAVKAGDFSLSGLFGAAQSKTSPVEGADITNPTPTLTLISDPSIQIDLSAIFIQESLDTEYWTTSAGKTGTQYHTREFYTATGEPEGYDPNWANDGPVQYFGSVFLTFTNGEGQAGSQAFGGSLIIPEFGDPDKFDFSGMLTVTGLGDYNHNAEGVDINLGADLDLLAILQIHGTDTGNPNAQSAANEALTFSLGSTDVPLSGTALDDGQVDFSGAFTQHTLAGSTVTLTLDYSYWA